VTGNTAFRVQGGERLIGEDNCDHCIQHKNSVRPSPVTLSAMATIGFIRCAPFVTWDSNWLPRARVYHGRGARQYRPRQITKAKLVGRRIYSNRGARLVILAQCWVYRLTAETQRKGSDRRVRAFASFSAWLR